MTIAFYCEFYNDIERLQRAVASLRKVYPDAHLTLVSDGSTRLAELGKFTEKTILVESERMYLLESGYDMWERRINLWSSMPGTHIVHFDTDALFHRKFQCEYPVNLPFMYGKLWQRKDGKIGMRGGSFGLTRGAVEALKTNFDPSVLPTPQSYPRPGYEEETVWVDGMGVDILEQARIRKRICCDFGVHPTFSPRGNFAVTHPHKDGN